ncbi:MAG: septum formation inhibitor Maf [Alteromonadaceae bacterium]|nr:septum formation inhibitor Maf [Alteromonadaceae bacterium]
MLILASSSPRRAELLQQLNIEFIQRAADIDETALEGENPEQMVLRLAIAKAKEVLEKSPHGQFALGSDTIGLLNGKVLVKPTDKTDFVQMMRSMSGQVHQVLTSVALCTANEHRALCVTSDVEFKELGDVEIEWYWASGEPQDKAGGYAIQGLGAQFVKQIKGSYSAIMGLPLYETVELMKQMGCSPYER